MAGEDRAAEDEDGCPRHGRVGKGRGRAADEDGRRGVQTRLGDNDGRRQGQAVDGNETGGGKAGRRMRTRANDLSGGDKNEQVLAADGDGRRTSGGEDGWQTVKPAIAGGGRNGRSEEQGGCPPTRTAQRQRRKTKMGKLGFLCMWGVAVRGRVLRGRRTGSCTTGFKIGRCVLALEESSYAEPILIFCASNG